jgi:hypothetical protein
MTINDYGTPTDTLAAPSLSEWAAAVATAVGGLQTGTSAVVAPVTGWADFGGAYAQMTVTRVGALVVAEMMVKPTADKAVTAGTPYQFATLPVGFRPTSNRIVAAMMTPGATASMRAIRVTVAASDGSISGISPVNETILAATGWVSVVTTFKGA